MNIEETANQVMEYLLRSPQEAHNAMHLKLALEISASKLFLALGWLNSRGRVALEVGDYGYVIRCLDGAKEQVAR